MNTTSDPLGAPAVCPPQTVLEDWIDYNGHLNMAFYNVIFDRGVDHVYDHLGIGERYTRSGAGSCFTLEVHLHYLNELALGDEVEVHFHLLDYDQKRLHFFEQMYHREQGYLAATSEQLALHVDMTSRRSAPFPPQALARIEALHAAHASLSVPDQVGHRIGIRRR